MIDLNLKAETIKLEDNIGKKLYYPGLRKDFLGRAHKAQYIKNKYISWTSSKLKTTALQKTN